MPDPTGSNYQAILASARDAVDKSKNYIAAKRRLRKEWAGMYDREAHDFIYLVMNERGIKWPWAGDPTS